MESGRKTAAEKLLMWAKVSIASVDKHPVSAAEVHIRMVQERKYCQETNGA